MVIPGTDHSQACDTVTDKVRNYLHPRQDWPWIRFESSRSLSANLEVFWRYEWVYPYMVTPRRAPFQRWRIPATWTRRDSQSVQGPISGMTPLYEYSSPSIYISLTEQFGMLLQCYDTECMPNPASDHYQLRVKDRLVTRNSQKNYILGSRDKLIVCTSKEDFSICSSRSTSHCGHLCLPWWVYCEGRWQIRFYWWILT